MQGWNYTTSLLLNDYCSWNACLKLNLMSIYNCMSIYSNHGVVYSRLGEVVDTYLIYKITWHTHTLQDVAGSKKNAGVTAMQKVNWINDLCGNNRWYLY